MQQYNYEIKHIIGKANIADSLSRLPLKKLDKTTSGHVCEEYVKFVVESDVSDTASAVSLRDVKEATANDPFMSELYKLIELGEWSDKIQFKAFQSLRQELSVYEGIILRGNRIVMPKQLQSKILKIAHESHMGIVRTKQMLRSKYFWCGMDKQIEEMVKVCDACVINNPLNVNTPLQPTSFPSGPWEKGAIDIVGPIGNKYLITFIDYYSSFPEVMITRDISSANIVRVLKDIFARFGLPEEIVSDNGPQFVSKEFETFLNKNGIRHVRSSPYHPQSNGKIEIFHRYLKKHFRAAVSEGKSWEDELPSILMAYRSTCHPMTGASPDVMLFK